MYVCICICKIQSLGIIIYVRKGGKRGRPTLVSNPSMQFSFNLTCLPFPTLPLLPSCCGHVIIIKTLRCCYEKRKKKTNTPGCLADPASEKTKGMDDTAKENQCLNSRTRSLDMQSLSRTCLKAFAINKSCMYRKELTK